MTNDVERDKGRKTEQFIIKVIVINETFRLSVKKKTLHLDKRSLITYAHTYIFTALLEDPLLGMQVGIVSF